MKILAIDSATELCSAALMGADGVFSRELLTASRGHAAHLLSMIDALLIEGVARLSDLAAIAFGRGPGAFTGVRLATSVAQGLGFSAGLGVVPVSDLRALAQRAFDSAPELTRVLACQDARMQQLYWSCFERGPDGLAAPVSEERVSSVGDIILPRSWGHDVGGAGPGFAIYPELVARADFARVFADYLPRAVEIARLAWPQVLLGNVVPPEQAAPTYVRDQVTATSRN
jgi:tRNA threonylcarbamoyladenosine biosynthesis protein TsaB